jgi:nucleoside-diphosphate-sugar epimerase
MSAKKRVLLTGASGFIGQSVMKHFEDCDFTIFEHRGKVLERNNIVERINSFEGTIPQSEVWINLAGKAHDLSRVQSDKPYWEANYDFVLQVYNEFLKQKEAKVFIHLSSIKAVADEPNRIIDETYPEDPKTVYGISKLEADKYIMSHLPTGDKRVYILRPTMVHGEGNKGNLNSLFKYCQSPLPYILGNYNGSRSYLSIENLLFVIDELINAAYPSDVFCLSDTDCIKTNELVSWIYSQLGKQARIVRVPRFLMGTLAWIGDYLPIPVNTDTLKKVGSDYLVDSKKVRRVIGKQFPVTAVDGMKKTLKTFTEVQN